jgi:hypothetical protein
MLDAVKAKSHRAGGKLVFPYTLVRVRLLGVPSEQEAVLRSDFLAEYFADELKTALARSNQRFPEDLHVAVSTTPELPLPGADWVSVEVEMAAQQPPEPVTARKPAKLVVVKGSANRSELLLSKTRINIGRGLEVYHTEGPSRRNDLAFIEDNATNRTVSREHAHILHSAKTGDYRIFNDRVYKTEADCRLWIVRDGLSQPVHRGSRGTLLHPGDEIHLGNAVVRFVLK